MTLIETLKKDHGVLKKFLKVLRSENADIESKVDAYTDMLPLFLAHVKAEEKVLYAYLKNNEELNYLGREGCEEHRLMDHLVNKINRTIDEDKWEARARVLADLLYHHLNEEEEKIYPEIKNRLDRSENRIMQEEYIKVRNRIFETKISTRDQERANWITAEI